MSEPITEVTREVAAPAERVWELLSDTGRWTEWGPQLGGVRSPERRIRQGLRGQVKVPPGIWLAFEITEFEPGRRWAWRVAGRHATGHRVESLESDRCRLVFELPAAGLGHRQLCRHAAERLARLAEARA